MAQTDIVVGTSLTHSPTHHLLPPSVVCLGDELLEGLKATIFSKS